MEAVREQGVEGLVLGQCILALRGKHLGLRLGEEGVGYPRVEAAQGVQEDVAQHQVVEALPPGLDGGPGGRLPAELTEPVKHGGLPLGFQDHGLCLSCAGVVRE